MSIPVPSTSQSNNSQSNNSRSIPIKVSNTNQSNNSQINSQINTSQSNTIPRNTNQSIPTSVNSDLVVPAVDVQIIGTTPELQKTVRKVIKTQVGGDTSQRQIQTDIQAILNTGLFRNATVSSSETPTGLRVVYRVQPLIVRGIQLEGAKVLKYDNASLIFKSQINQPISPDGLKEAVKNINKWYADKGYSLARVVAIEPTRQGSLMIKVAEGVVGNIKFQFVNDDGKTVSDKGKPVKGRTKTEFLKKQIKLKSGDVFQDKIVRQDLQKLYSLGLFESANIALEGDANQADVIYKLKEVGARSVNLGGNYNADQGLVGTFNYSDNNVRGTNNNVGVNIQAGRRHLGFNAKYSSPYRSTNPDKLGYSINAFRRRGISETFDEDIKLPNGDKVRKGQFGASFQLQRPIEDWNATLGFNYSRTSLRDRKGVINSVDENGNPLSLSGTGIDDLTTVSLSATKDRRNNLMNPTNGSVLTLSSEQSIPLGQGNISMNRLQANYSQFVPVEVFKSKKKQVLAVNVQAGTVFGDLPPYETFNLGGSNSIRGYDAGDVASGRTYVLASAEYRFPIPVTNSLGGVLFADFGTDLGSGSTVIGNPAGVSGKPGAGFGYGAGLRLNSPLGLLRADYGISDHGETKLHFGIGHRF
ncbi:MAG: BamA/TamA family outer membrane protein [Cyanobacteria bacterium P01_A01_bin.84]